MNLGFWLELAASGLITGGIYALVALGLNLQYGLMRIMNISHGEFLMLGAYLTWLAHTVLGFNPLLFLPAAARVHPRTRVPSVTTLLTGLVVASAALVGDAAETYDLTNIGTLFAFALVCAGVLTLRVIEPDRPRPFRVPLVWVVAPLGAAACVFIMVGLPYQAWERFAIWLALGLALYFVYGFQHSRLQGSQPT